jgi:hypothetical protein
VAVDRPEGDQGGEINHAATLPGHTHNHSLVLHGLVGPGSAS